MQFLLLHNNQTDRTRLPLVCVVCLCLANVGTSVLYPFNATSTRRMCLYTYAFLPVWLCVLHRSPMYWKSAQIKCLTL